jgi:hypothetical protein
MDEFTKLLIVIVLHALGCLLDTNAGKQLS